MQEEDQSTRADSPSLHYSGPRQIKQAKMDDLISLLSFVPPAYHDFYKDLEKAGRCLLTVIMTTNVQKDEDSEDIRIFVIQMANTIEFLNLLQQYWYSHNHQITIISFYEIFIVAIAKNYDVLKIMQACVDTSGGVRMKIIACWASWVMLDFNLCA